MTVVLLHVRNRRHVQGDQETGTLEPFGRGRGPREAANNSRPSANRSETRRNKGTVHVAERGERREGKGREAK